MDAAARLKLVPPVIPEGWSAPWRGISGLFYARTLRRSPPLIARAATEEELPAAISRAVADHEAARKRAQAQMGEQEPRYLAP